MTLSNQAIGAIMMALQKGIMDQQDITGILRDFEIAVDTDTQELTIMNPPTIKAADDETD
tara:strand:- start:4518 stop:4697 length:180 start_codon:yes stop_codon:yes gene_type:complete